MATAAKSDDEEYVDSSSDSIAMDEWQELSKSDYAKVIFSDLYHNPDSGVGCKFQITDNVHEDPCDFVGLFRVGYDTLDQSIVTKMLSKTECEEDGKLLRCIFQKDELPELEDGFYQFLYVTRDSEVCGASMPFEIKQSQPRDVLSEALADLCDVVAEKTEDDFVLVRHGLERKNEMLGQLVEQYRLKNVALSSDMDVLIETRDRICQDKEDVIANLSQEIVALKEQCYENQCLLNRKDRTIQDIMIRMEAYKTAHAKSSVEHNKAFLKVGVLTKEKDNLSKELQKQISLVKQKDESLSFVQPDGRALIEQLEDQKFMIKALEDSKALALKEMNDLSESLIKRNKVLSQTKSELASCKEKIQELTTNCDLQTENTDKLKKEVKDLMQVLGEKEDMFGKQTENTDKLKKEVKDLMRLLAEKEDVLVKQSMTIIELEVECKKQNTVEQDVVLTKSEETQSDPKDFEEVDDNRLLKEADQKAVELGILLTKILGNIDFKNKSQATLFFNVKIQLLAMISKMSPEGSSYKKTTNGKEPMSKTNPKPIVDSCRERYNRRKESIPLPWAPLKSPEKKDISKPEKSSTMRKKTKPKSKFQILSDMFYEQERRQRAEERHNHRHKHYTSKAARAAKMEAAIEILCSERRQKLKFQKIEGNPGIFWKLQNSKDLAKGDLHLINQLTDQISKGESKVRAESEVVAEPDFLVEPDFRAESGSCTECAIAAESEIQPVSDFEFAFSAPPVAVPKISSFDMIICERCCKTDSVSCGTRKYSLSEATMTAKLASLDRFLTFMRKHLGTHHNLLDYIDGYNMQYDHHPLRTKIDFILDDCKTTYKYEILQEELEAQRTVIVKLSFETVHFQQELKKRDDLVRALSIEKLSFSKDKEAHRRTVNEHIDRLLVAADLYKKQFIEIENLKKKLKKLKRSPQKASSSKASASVSEISSESACETVGAVSNQKLISCDGSDSDTGEHVLGNNIPAQSRDAPENIRQSLQVECPQLSVALSKNQKISVYVTSPEKATREAFQELIDMQVIGGTLRLPEAKIDSSDATSVLPTNETTNVACSSRIPSDEEFQIPCNLCGETYTVTSKSTAALVDHMEQKHQINICPICGVFFEACVPKRYINYHIEDHFNDE